MPADVTTYVNWYAASLLLCLQRFCLVATNYFNEEPKSYQVYWWSAWNIMKSSCRMNVCNKDGSYSILFARFLQWWRENFLNYEGISNFFFFFWWYVSELLCSTCLIRMYAYLYVCVCMSFLTFPNSDGRIDPNIKFLFAVSVCFSILMVPRPAVLHDRCIYMSLQYKAVVSWPLKMIKITEFSHTVIWHLKRKRDYNDFL